MKIGAIALFGFLALSPAVRAADTPAFVNATMCDAAAPITAKITVFGRQVRAETRVTKRPAARPRHNAAAHGRRAAARPTPRRVEEVEVPSGENEAVLRPAVHFCVTPAGWDNPVRYT